MASLAIEAWRASIALEALRDSILVMEAGRDKLVVGAIDRLAIAAIYAIDSMANGASGAGTAIEA